MYNHCINQCELYIYNQHTNVTIITVIASDSINMTGCTAMSAFHAHCSPSIFRSTLSCSVCSLLCWRLYMILHFLPALYAHGYRVTACDCILELPCMQCSPPGMEHTPDSQVFQFTYCHQQCMHKLQTVFVAGIWFTWC